MGTDNLFQKRKAKSYERKPENRAAGKRLLIVCEGSKTEPHYFKELRHDLRLQTADVMVCGKECGSDPASVYSYAQKLYEEESCLYDYVYCVIDTDDHKTLEKTLEQIKRKGTPYIPIVSSPCFEFWLILHHTLHQKSFHPTSKKSIGESVESALKKFDKAYAKGKPGVWIRYKSKLQDAISNAKVVYKKAQATGNKNPSTEIHIVVETMLAMKR